jgi:hypothetical protein
LRGHCNQILLYNKKNKVRDALRARFDRLACLTGSLAKYVSILRGISSRFQNFASRGEVAPRERVAMPIRSQLHACCRVETRRDTILMEMRREVSFLVM